MTLAGRQKQEYESQNPTDAIYVEAFFRYYQLNRFFTHSLIDNHNSFTFLTEMFQLFPICEAFPEQEYYVD